MDLVTCQSGNNRLHLPHKYSRETSILMSEVAQALAHSRAAHDQEFDGTTRSYLVSLLLTSMRGASPAADRAMMRRAKPKRSCSDSCLAWPKSSKAAASGASSQQYAHGHVHSAQDSSVL